MRCFIELLSKCEMLLGVLLTSALFPTGLHINGEWYGVDPQGGSNFTATPPGSL